MLSYLDRFTWIYRVNNAKTNGSREGKDRNRNRMAGGGRVRARRVEEIVKRDQQGTSKRAGEERQGSNRAEVEKIGRW